MEYNHVAFGIVLIFVLIIAGQLTALLPQEYITANHIAFASPPSSIVCSDRDIRLANPAYSRTSVTARFSNGASQQQTDSCYNATAVNEKICSADHSIGTMISDCPFPKPVCDNGACAATTISCSDNDITDNLYVKGELSIEYRRVNPANPNEIQHARRVYLDGCDNGKLVQVGCPTDVQSSGNLQDPYVPLSYTSCPTGYTCQDGLCK